MQYSTLRFDPSQVAALTSVFNDAIDKMDRVVKSVEDNGFLHEPWLGDEVSAWVATRYNQVAVLGENGDGKGSALDCLRQFRDGLQAVVDQINATAAAYAQSDQAAVDGLPEPS